MKLNIQILKLALLLLAVIPFADLKIHRRGGDLLDAASRLVRSLDFGRDLEDLFSNKDKGNYDYFTQGISKVLEFNSEFEMTCKSKLEYPSSSTIGTNTLDDQTYCKYLKSKRKEFFDDKFTQAISAQTIHENNYDYRNFRDYLLKLEKALAEVNVIVNISGATAAFYENRYFDQKEKLSKLNCNDFTKNAVSEVRKFMPKILTMCNVSVKVTPDLIIKKGAIIKDFFSWMMMKEVAMCLFNIYDNKHIKEIVLSNLGQISVLLIKNAIHNSKEGKDRRYFK